MYKTQIGNIPSDISEISYSVFLLLISAASDIDKLEVLTGQDLKHLPGTAANERLIAGGICMLDRLEKDIWEWMGSKPQPKETIEILGKNIKFDKDLGKLPYWAMVKAKDIVKLMGKEPFNSYEHYQSLVGHYLYPRFEYNEYKAEQFSEEVVVDMAFQEVILLGDFFLYMQSRLWMRKLSYYNLKFQIMKKRLALMFSLNTAS